MTTSQEKIQHCKHGSTQHVYCPHCHVESLLPELDAAAQKLATTELICIDALNGIGTIQQQLDAAKQENERLKEQRDRTLGEWHDSMNVSGSLINTVETIQQRLKQAEEALEYYAKDETYGEIRIMPPIPDIPILYDCGTLAQHTLSLIRGEVGNPSLKGE